MVWYARFVMVGATERALGLANALPKRDAFFTFIARAKMSLIWFPYDSKAGNQGATIL
jgi:hypothetical protein